jgi:hypothetical protein
MSIESRRAKPKRESIPLTAEKIYLITGNDRGDSRVREFLIVDETEKIWFARNKRFAKIKENQPYGQIFDWVVWTSEKENVLPLRIENVECHIGSHNQMIEFVQDTFERDYQTFVIGAGIPDPYQVLYNEARDRLDKHIEKLQTIVSKIERKVEELKGEL